MAISIFEPDDIAYITIFAAQAQVFHGTIIMTLVIPITITMLSGERINYNNLSILVTSILIMAMMMIHYNACIGNLLLLISRHMIHNYTIFTLY